jgi:trehalose/maltose hydrolase-like predicted phosphorylase
MMRIFTSLIVLAFLGSASAQDNWLISADSIDRSNYYGISSANGVIGIVSSSEPLKVSDVILNGVYDYYQRGRVSNILKSFKHLDLAMDIDGTALKSTNVNDYRQVFDMKNASINSFFNYGDKLSITSSIMALRHLPYTAIHLIELEAHDTLEFTAYSEILSPDHLIDVRNTYSEIDRPHVLIPLMSSVADSPSSRITVAASNSILFEEKHEQAPRLIHEDWDYNRHLVKFTKKLAPGENYRFAVIASTCSSVQYNDPLNEAERLTIYAALEGTERLMKRHNDAWNELWKSDISIENRPDLTRDIRQALYHLYAFAREGTAYSLSPMGLSGLGYNGHVFWDTELWMYPPLLIMQPEIAKSLLEYRFERLEAAKKNAFAHGYKGAMFPWESAADGSEDTPVWALTGPFEHHITGCIAWAFWKYYQLTGDKEWLASRAYPVLSEVADFWASRVERNGRGKYSIRNVVAADEWAENVDDNAFTNAVAILSLHYAHEAAKILGKKSKPDWMHVADNIMILNFENGVTREHASYRGEIIKQADVNLLSFPLEFYSNEDQIRRDLEYYEPRISPSGPAMGSAILSVLYNRLGDIDKAEEVFLKSYKPNELPPFGVLAETAGGTNPYFATGAGGMLQAVISGFGGLVIRDGGLQKIESRIPESWGKLLISGAGVDELNYELK